MKHTTYWRVRSAPDPRDKPQWEELKAAPTTRSGLVGDLRIENDDQIMMLYFVDGAVQERVTRGARDAAALAQEFMIPHKPWNSAQKPESSDS